MRVSVVVPAYNEAVNVPHVVEAFDQFVEKHKNYEVIIVDDGSDDGTEQAVEQSKRPYLRAIRHKRNMGKTQAIITGADAATGDIIVVFDADLQFDINDIPRLVALIEAGADVAAGWKQGKYEKKFGKIQNTIPNGEKKNK